MGPHFNINICSCLLNLLYSCILLHTPIYSFVKTNGNRILLPVSIFPDSNHWRRSYDVVKIFRMAVVDVANQLPVPIWQSGCPLSTKFHKDIYLNPRLSYNYFRFCKTNGRHIEILLPVSILTCQSSLASHFGSAHQISCESAA